MSEEKKQTSQSRLIIVATVVVALIVVAALLYFFTDFSGKEVEYAVTGHTHNISEITGFNPDEYVRKDQLDSLFSSWLKRQEEKEEEARIAALNEKIKKLIPEMPEELTITADKIRTVVMSPDNDPAKLYDQVPYGPKQLRKLISLNLPLVNIAKKLMTILPNQGQMLRNQAAMMVAFAQAIKPYRQFAKIEERLEPDAENPDVFYKVRVFKNSILDSLSKNSDPFCVKVLRNTDILDFATKVASSLCGNEDIAKYKEEMEKYVEEQLGPLSNYTGTGKSVTKKPIKTEKSGKKRPRW